MWVLFLGGGACKSIAVGHRHLLLRGVTCSSRVGQPCRYTADLLALDGCRASQFLLPSPRFADIVTPLREDRWQLALRDHPDRSFANYIVEGICSGFRIGFQWGSVTCKSARRNMPSAAQCEKEID